MRNSLKKWLTNTITWKKYVSINAYNEREYTSETVPCRIIYKTKIHKNLVGELVNTEYIIYLEPTDVVGISDKDAFTIGGRDIEIVTFHKIEDNLGNIYGYEIFL